MASFFILVYFPFRYQSFLVNNDLSYTDLIKIVFRHFHIDSLDNPDAFLLEIFDPRYKGYIEFDDDYLNLLRRRLSRANVENRKARIICRQQIYLLSQQTYLSSHEQRISFTHQQQNPSTSLPYVIIWLDEYFASPRDFRSLKKYLFNATTFDGPIHVPYWLEYDIDNLIMADYKIDFNTFSSDSHLKMFTDVDECRDYIINQENKLILLITSDENGEKILPTIHHRIMHTYVLSNSWRDLDWGYDYIESLQIFDDDQHMLTRVIHDLAQCVLDKASYAEPNEAWIYLNGAKKLYLEADRAHCCRCRRCIHEKLAYIDREIENIKNILYASSTDHDIVQECFDHK